MTAPTVTVAAPATDPEQRGPRIGEPFVLYTEAGQDVLGTVKRPMRKTNDITPVFTVHDEHGNFRWLRWDRVRGMWVRAGCERDGGEVPR